MSFQTVLLLLGLTLLTGFLSFLLGSYVERRRESDKYMARMRKLKEVEEKAKQTLLLELEEIERKRVELENTSWKALMEEVKKRSN